MRDSKTYNIDCDVLSESDFVVFQPKCSNKRMVVKFLFSFHMQ